MSRLDAREMSNKSAFDIGAGDRVLLCALTPIVILMCVGALMVALNWHPGDIPLRILRIVVLEGVTTLVFVTSLALLYAIAKPKWVQVLLEQHLPKAARFLLVLTAILCVVFCYMFA